MLENIVNKLSSNPKQLFLIDGLGALVSAFFLGVVLVQLESIFGIPKNTLYFLAFLPCLFAMYDFYCYLRVQENFSFFIKTIALINLMYCFISIGLAFYHYQKITYLGWGYVLVEILIVVFIAYAELTTAAKIKTEE